MTVCITGDVHHMSLETRDQKYMESTEVAAAIEYAEIAAEYDLPVTLFLTGKAVSEEPNRVDRLAAMDNVELGGHNYYAFGTLAHKAFRGLFGTWNGPRWFQGWEIDKTIEAFANRGVDITAWRDHAYRHDDNTAEVLSERGITHFSDVVGPDESLRDESGLTVVPINTPPDHEHVYHAFRTPDFVAESDFEGPFGDDSYEVGEWAEKVLEAVKGRIDERQPATVLAHPACMNLADGFDAFEALCTQLSEEHATTAISEIRA
jgi:hypothetical protein